MIKIVFCLRRQAGVSLENFQKYWRTGHAALVKDRAQLLSIRRYVQSHTISDRRLSYLADQRGFAGEPFDGVAELWFDGVEVLYPNDSAAEASLKAARDLLADEAEFVDLANSPIFVVREHEIFDARTPGSSITGN